MTELQHLLLILIQIDEILPFVLFINCILRAMPRYKQQSYNHPGQMTIFQIQRQKRKLRLHRSILIAKSLNL